MEIIATGFVVVGVILVIYGLIPEKNKINHSTAEYIPPVTNQNSTMSNKINTELNSVITSFKDHPLRSLLFITIFTFIIKKVVDVIKILKEKNSSDISSQVLNSPNLFNLANNLS